MSLALSSCKDTLATGVNAYMRYYIKLAYACIEINEYEMEDSSFMVTLPSNSNMQTHPSNRGHNYVVKLARPINLCN